MILKKIKIKPVYGMALDRKNALKRLSHFSNNITLHISFCVAYGLDCPAFNSWIDELTAWLAEAGSISVTHYGKFNYDTYRDTVFGALGDARSDAEYELKNLLEDIKSGKLKDKHDYNYPEFEITSQMITQLHSISVEIIQQICGYFEGMQKYEKADKEYIKRVLKSIFYDIL